MDVFQVIRQLPSVKKVSSMPPEYPQPFTCLFFLCPALNGQGIRVNHCETGVTGKYKEGLSNSSRERLLLVKQFQKELGESGIQFTLKAIYATADSLLLFSPPIGPSAAPKLEFPTTTNHQAVYERIHTWYTYYCQAPWQSLPQRFVAEGRKRLASLLPCDCPAHVGEDFILRVFAGFALDGVLIKDSHFGHNPVLLGVESPEVAILQNAALGNSERLPVIQLA